MYEGVYQQVLSALGLDKMEPDERVKALLSLPLDDVTARLPPSIAFLPVIDGEILPTKPTYEAVSRQDDQQLPGKKWLDGFMIGDSQFDVRFVPSLAFASCLTVWFGFRRPHWVRSWAT